jgi:hypothetical protein
MDRQALYGDSDPDLYRGEMDKISAEASTKASKEMTTSYVACRNRYRPNTTINRIHIRLIP